MAISATFRGGIAGIPTAALGSFTPAAGSRLLALFCGSITVAEDPTSRLSITGGGLTWVLVDLFFTTISGRASFASVWAADVGASPVSTSVVAACSSNNDGASVAVVELSADEPLGFGAVGGAGRNNATGALSFDLDGAPGESSRVYSAVYMKSGDGVDGSRMTPGTGWAEVWERPEGGSLTMAVQSRDDSTSPTVGWDLVNASGSSTLAAAIAIEVTEGVLEPITGTMAAAETGPDVVAGAARVLVRGVLSALSAGVDAVAGLARVLVRGAMAAGEAGQDAVETIEPPAPPAAVPNHFAGLPNIFTSVLGQAVTVTDRYGATRSLRGIFVNRTYEDMGVSSQQPAVHLREVDVAGVVDGCLVVVSGREYSARTVDPDGRGMATIRLERR